MMGEDVQVRLYVALGRLQVATEAEQLAQEGQRPHALLPLDQGVPSRIAERRGGAADHLRPGLSLVYAGIEAVQQTGVEPRALRLLALPLWSQVLAEVGLDPGLEVLHARQPEEPARIPRRERLPELAKGLRVGLPSAGGNIRRPILAGRPVRGIVCGEHDLHAAGCGVPDCAIDRAEVVRGIARVRRDYWLRSDNAPPIDVDSNQTGAGTRGAAEPSASCRGVGCSEHLVVDEPRLQTARPSTWRVRYGDDE